MIATKEYIKQRFDEMNERMFGGSLPDIPIELSKAKTFLGQCAFKKRRKLLGRTELYDFRLKISVAFDLPAEELDDVILHEMIHYYIGVNRLKDTSAHGKIFRSMMKDLNKGFGRNVSISHRLTQEQKQQMATAKRRWRMVAVIEFDDGRIGIKVIPRIKERILYYFNNVKRAKGVVAINIYQTDNPFFSQYPNSASLKYHYIDKTTLHEHLHKEEKVMCDGKTLIYKAKNRSNHK